MELNFALYDWLGSISYRAQGTLLTCLRGGDNADCDELKVYIRFIRSVVLKPATKQATKTFMRREALPFQIDGRLAVQIDKSPVHLISHIMNAMRIVWEYHPDKSTANEAEIAYRVLVDYLHLTIETKEHFDKRIADDKS